MLPAEDVREIFDDMLTWLMSPDAGADRFNMGFFAVLHQFCRIMGMGQNQGKLLAHIANQMGMPVPSVALGRISVEERRLAERHPLVIFALWLIADVDRLGLAWRAKAVRYNLMVRDLHVPPTWYLRVVEQFLRGR